MTEHTASNHWRQRSLWRHLSRPTSGSHPLEIERERLVRRGKLSGMHWLVISLSLSLTGAAWYSANSAQQARAEQRFVSESDRVVNQFTDRLRRYDDVLSGTLATISSKQGQMTQEQWRLYAQRLDILDEFPATSGIGVVEYVPRDVLPAFVAEQRQLNPGFQVFNVPPDNASAVVQAQDMDFHLPLTLVAPERLEDRATGFDLAAYEERRKTIMRAAYLNEIQLTPPTPIYGDWEQGFLMAAPFYQHGEEPSWGERRDAFAGAIVASVRSNEFRDEVLYTLRPLIAVSVFDGDESVIPASEENVANTDPAPLFTQTQSVTLYGRKWDFRLTSTMAFRQDILTRAPLMVLVGGLVIDLLLLLLFLSVSKGKREAVAFADYATGQLRQQSEQLQERSDELEHANEELDQVAHTVSHDLKSPLNGIQSLTEFILEEIEENPDYESAKRTLRKDVGRIQQQIGRSRSLIEGILDYSGVGSRQEVLVSVDTSTLVQEIRDILQLEPGELDVEGELPTLITADTRLHQVLVNLIGNAFKYHHDRPAARVTVSAIRAGDFYRFTVADNGPGIDPQFHDRVFKPFLTLQSRDLIESSGVGLAIVRKSVERYGGQITLTSTVGQGAAFSFDWPVHIDESADDCGPEPLAKVA